MITSQLPRISAVVICYKQENYIRRAIDSLLRQKTYLYEICVSDDCSPDATWSVLQEYANMYPGLFKLHQNNPNVGIFENVEFSWTMPTGDLVYQLSGDDECPDGWFESVVKFIQENDIDYLNKSICIYGDYQCQYPNGDYFVKSNKLVESSSDLVSLNLRQIVGNRSACYSISIMRKFFKVSRGRSYVAEWAQEIQLPLFTEQAYYIHQVGNIYYTRIGVNVTFKKSTLLERVGNFPYMKQCLNDAGYCLSTKDNRYISLQKLRYMQFVSWSLTRWLKIVVLRLTSVHYRYGYVELVVRRYKRRVFAVLTRVPHSKPLSMNI